MKANIPEVEALVNTDRSLVCDGKKGLLTRILTVMKREPPDSSFRSASGGEKEEIIFRFSSLLTVSSVPVLEQQALFSLQIFLKISLLFWFFKLC